MPTSTNTPEPGAPGAPGAHGEPGAPAAPGSTGGSLFAGKPEASRRRRTRTRATLYKVAAPLARTLGGALWSSLRIEKVVGREHVEPLVRSGEPFVPCFWHEHLIVCLRWLVASASETFRPAILISPSVDGDLFEEILRPWPVEVVRGSATRTGARALRGLHRSLKRDGGSPVILPDGPQGPPRIAKPGAIMLAQLAGVPIVPMAYGARRAIRLDSWDRLLVPFPFTRAGLVFGEPLTVPRDLSSEGLAEETGRLQSALDRVAFEAERLYSRRVIPPPSLDPGD